MKRKKTKISLTSKEARKIALGLSAILSFALAGFLMRSEGIKILLLFTLLMFALFYYTLKAILRVDRRKEIEIQKEMRARIKNLLGDQRRQIEFGFIDTDSKDDEWEDLVEEILEKSNFNYYAYVEKGRLIIEVRHNDKIICKKNVSFAFFYENFMLK